MTIKEIVEQKIDDASYIDMQITKFNPELYKRDLSDDENFITQLKDANKKDFRNDEYLEYLHLKLDYLKSFCESLYAEMFLLDFQKERNHPDKDIYIDTDDNPSSAMCHYYEDEVKELKELIDKVEITYFRKIP